MKKIFTIPLILLSSINYSYSQSVDKVIGLQVTQSSTKGGYSEIILLGGIKTDEGDEFTIGGTLRHLNQSNVGHKGNYIGGSLHGQSGLFYPILVSIKADFLYGEWWLGKYENPDDINVRKEMIFFGTLRVGYAINENLDVYVGYSPFMYNPKDYVEKHVTAFQRHSFNVSLKYTISLGESFKQFSSPYRRRYF